MTDPPLLFGWIQGDFCSFSAASISAQEGACQSSTTPSQLCANNVFPSGENSIQPVNWPRLRKLRRPRWAT